MPFDRLHAKTAATARALTRRRALSLAVIAAALAGAACDNDNDSTGPRTGAERTYDQVQRLGNPLVSEVFLLKRDHPFHATVGPADDTAFVQTIKGFVAQFRPNATTLQNTLAAVLIPDMLIVQTDKDPSTAGWLSWALSNGYGGRKLTDDVVDVGLTGIFSPLLDPTQAVCQPFQLPLCTDNVGSHSAFTTTFPYLAPPK